jgi:hypothetical protein
VSGAGALPPPAPTLRLRLRSGRHPAATSAWLLRLLAVATTSGSGSDADRLAALRALNGTLQGPDSPARAYACRLLATWRAVAPAASTLASQLAIVGAALPCVMRATPLTPADVPRIPPPAPPPPAALPAGGLARRGRGRGRGALGGRGGAMVAVPPAVVAGAPPPLAPAAPAVGSKRPGSSVRAAGDVAAAVSLSPLDIVAAALPAGGDASRTPASRAAHSAPTAGLLERAVDALQSCGSVLEAFGRSPATLLVPAALAVTVAELGAAARAAVDGAALPANPAVPASATAGSDFFTGDEGEEEGEEAAEAGDSDEMAPQEEEVEEDEWEDVGVDAAPRGGGGGGGGGGGASDAVEDGAEFLAAIADPLLSLTRSILPRLQQLQRSLAGTSRHGAAGAAAALPFPLTRGDVDLLLPAVSRACSGILAAVRVALHAHLPPLATVLEAEGGGVTAAAKRKRLASGGHEEGAAGPQVDPLAAASAAAAARGLDALLTAALARQEAANRALYGAEWDSIGRASGAEGEGGGGGGPASGP